MPPELAITIPHATAALVPVCLFLGALVLMDSYKLVSARWVAYALLAGMGAALASFLIQSNIIAGLGVPFSTLSRYVAPAVEEAAKGVLLIVLIRSHRIGFQVDAAIVGFAVGTGFALTENVYYLTTHAGMGLFTWLLRGLGTAMMHGGTTCLFGIISKTLFDRAESSKGASDRKELARHRPHVGRRPEKRPSIATFIPGLIVAYVLHSAFNHFLLPPLAMTALIVGIFPLLILAVFQQSERATRHWLGSGFDTDQAILEALTFGNVADDPVGRYLQDLRAHFSGEVVADMLCLLRLRAELAIKAKGMLMMREAGYRPDPGPEVQATLEEIAYLEKSIGPTGLLALAPFLDATARENWQMHLLKAG